MMSRNLLKAFVGATALGLGASLHATPLFTDTFDRPDSEDLNESTDGKSGIFGALDWVQMSSGGGMEVIENQLVGGDDGARGGWAMSYLDHNFVDPAIAEAGGFSVTIDIEEYNNTGGVARHVGIAVGMSEEDAEGWSHNNPANIDYTDLFVGFIDSTRNNNNGRTAIEAYESGTLVINNTGSGDRDELPKTLRVDFSFSSFDAGSPVNYVITFGDEQMGTGTFTWSGTDENYIGIYSNITGRGAVIDQFEITADVPVPPFALRISPNGDDFDFEWDSQDGKVYDLLSSVDLSTPIADWPVYEAGGMVYEEIPSAGSTTTLTAVPSTDPHRFFAMRETDAPPPPPLLEANFEEDDGGFTTSADEGTAWEWGTPDSSGFGGTVNAGNDAEPGAGRAWGTNLGAYDDGAGDPGFYADPTVNSRLISPEIDLTEVAAAELTFAQAIDVDLNDSAVVRIYDAATGDEIIDGDFPLVIEDPDLEAAPWEASGPHALPVGAPIRIEWILSGIGGAQADFMGWYIDDVTVTEIIP